MSTFVISLFEAITLMLQSQKGKTKSLKWKVKVKNVATTHTYTHTHKRANIIFIIWCIAKWAKQQFNAGCCTTYFWTGVLLDLQTIMWEISVMSSFFRPGLDRFSCFYFCEGYIKKIKSLFNLKRKVYFSSSAMLWQALKP